MLLVKVSLTKPWLVPSFFPLRQLGQVWTVALGYLPPQVQQRPHFYRLFWLKVTHLELVLKPPLEQLAPSACT